MVPATYVGLLYVLGYQYYTGILEYFHLPICLFSANSKAILVLGSSVLFHAVPTLIKLLYLSVGCFCLMVLMSMITALRSDSAQPKFLNKLNGRLDRLNEFQHKVVYGNGRHFIRGFLVLVFFIIFLITAMTFFATIFLIKPEVLGQKHASQYIKTWNTTLANYKKCAISKSKCKNDNYPGLYLISDDKKTYKGFAHVCRKSCQRKEVMLARFNALCHAFVLT